MIGDVITIPLNTTGPIRLPGADGRPATSLGQFVTGVENHLVHFVTELMDGPPAAYNPVVLQGAGGMGKSLLAHGLVARWKQNNKGSIATLTTGADFAREYARAVETDSVRDLHGRYRRASLMVVDDLHQIGTKQAAQEELLLILDALLQRRSWFVVTLKQPLNETTILTRRLASRLSAGLTVPLAPPSPAARREILSRLATARQTPISENGMTLLLDHIADRFGPAATATQLTHILMEWEQFVGQAEQPGDDSLIRQFLAERSPPQGPQLRWIARQVSRYFKFKVADLKGPARQQRVVRARGVAMLLARQLTDHSLERIGQHFGNRDHTTVLHACRKTESLIATDASIRKAIDDLTLQLTE